MVRRSLRAAALAGIAACQPAAVSAQPAQAIAASGASGCGGRAALFSAARGARLWVTRRGAMALPENPLRPLTRENAVVLEVVVNGRVATAWGPDHANLRQGRAARDIERDGAGPIRWDEGPALADTLRVVAEDGSVLLGPMRFLSCEDAPAAKAAAPAAASRKPTAEGRARRPSDASGREPPGMPQGALDGLTLPPGATP